jgi:co-chaperonin GroES (HSP10)
MNFIPAHRHVLVQKRERAEEKKEPLVLVPDGYEPKIDAYTRVRVIKTANNCTIPAVPGDELVIREAFIEELSLDGNTFYLVLENHVMGVIKNEETII